MQTSDAERATPAITGRDPRRIGQLGGETNQTHNTVPPSAATTAYLLAEICCAALRARLVVSDLDAIGLALKAGLISPAQAVTHLHDIDLLRLVGAPSPECAS